MAVSTTVPLVHTSVYPNARPIARQGHSDICFPRNTDELVARIGYTPVVGSFMEDSTWYLDPMEDTTLSWRPVASTDFAIQQPTWCGSKFGYDVLTSAGTAYFDPASTDLLELADSGNDVWWLLHAYIPNNTADTYFLFNKYQGATSGGYALNAMLTPDVMQTVYREQAVINPIEYITLDCNRNTWATIVFGYSMTNGIAYMACKSGGRLTSGTADISGFSGMNNGAFFFATRQSNNLIGIRTALLAGFNDVLTLADAEAVANKLI